MRDLSASSKCLRALFVGGSHSYCRQNNSSLYSPLSALIVMAANYLPCDRLDYVENNRGDIPLHCRRSCRLSQDAYMQPRRPLSSPAHINAYYSALPCLS